MKSCFKNPRRIYIRVFKTRTPEHFFFSLFFLSPFSSPFLLFFFFLFLSLSPISLFPSTFRRQSDRLQPRPTSEKLPRPIPTVVGPPSGQKLIETSRIVAAFPARSTPAITRHLCATIGLASPSSESGDPGSSLVHPSSPALTQARPQASLPHARTAQAHTTQRHPLPDRPPSTRARSLGPGSTRPRPSRIQSRTRHD